MSTVKAKLNEVAKDIEVSNQELIDLLSDLGIKGKKATASLNEEELNLILETYSKKYEVKTFDDYFKKGEEERKMKAEGTFSYLSCIGCFFRITLLNHIFSKVHTTTSSAKTRVACIPA